MKRMLPTIENLLYRRPKSSSFGSPQTSLLDRVLSGLVQAWLPINRSPSLVAAIEPSVAGE